MALKITRIQCHLAFPFNALLLLGFMLVVLLLGFHQSHAQVLIEVEEDAIPRLNKDGIGLDVDEGGLEGVQWGKTDRDLQIRLLKNLRLRLLPPRLYLLATRLIQSRGVTQTDANDSTLFEARLDVLLQNGASDEVLAILAKLPRAQFDNLLWRTYFEAQLMKGTMQDVCKEVGNIGITQTRHSFISLMILLCLHVAEEEERATQFYLDLEVRQADDFDNIHDWLRYLRSKDVMQAWYEKSSIQFEDLKPVEYLLLRNGAVDWTDLTDTHTTAGFRRVLVSVLEGDFTQVPPSVLDAMLVDGWLSLEAYLDALDLHPDYQHWALTLRLALEKQESAKQVRAVLMEKSTPHSYSVWLQGLARLHKSPLRDLDIRAHFVHDVDRLATVINDLPAGYEDEKQYVSQYLNALPKQLSHQVGQTDSEELKLLELGLAGQLTWSRLSDFSFFRQPDMAVDALWLRELYESIARRDMTNIILQMATHAGGLDFSNKHIAMIAVYSHALSVLGFSSEAEELVQEFLRLQWIQKEI